ncbi:MAG: NAD(P)H-hydrate dehydratase [Candidatus Omnitrophica bacterium]|nr:NAD(P)H-hydrate dehydratase [Candidatus Omnitrophota bacterium]
MRLPTQLLRRKPDSNKSNFGHIFILAGSSRYSGAAVLCSEAAIRSGAGLVTLGIPKSLNNPIIKIKPKEVMTLPLPETKQVSLGIKAFSLIKDFMVKADVLVLGPGLSQDNQTLQLARKIVYTIKKPTVIDADGLNALVGNLDVFQGTKILTPHPGEMARLLGIEVSDVQKNRKKLAKELAKDYNCIVVLKGHKTIVADSKGKTFLNTTGNPGMATAGSGDVLSGIIGAFLGQGLTGFEAAKYGVYLHGVAGDLAALKKTQISLIASDIIAKIPEAIKRCN